MIVCDPHWDFLKAGLRLRGLWDLQLSSKEEIETLVARMNGGDTEFDGDLFDSALAAQCLILQRAFETQGLEELCLDENACPLCGCKAIKEDPLIWVNEVCDEILTSATTLGLVDFTLQ